MAKGEFFFNKENTPLDPKDIKFSFDKFVDEIVESEEKKKKVLEEEDPPERRHLRYREKAGNRIRYRGKK